jgi:hypothetical protein
LYPEAKGQLKMIVGAFIAAVGCRNNSDLAGNKSLQSNQWQSRILRKVTDPVTEDATYGDHHIVHHIPHKKGKGSAITHRFTWSQP